MREPASATQSLWEKLTFDDRLQQNDQFTSYHGHLNSASVKVTIFSESLSRNTRFRAAFRTDVVALAGLNHHSIVRLVDWGEHQGALFYVTEFENYQRLDLWMQNHELTWDEVADVCWQLASALQHAHNLGLTHGRFDRQAVYLDDSLRIQVAGFGVYGWIDYASDPGLPLHGLARFQQDIVSFGQLLKLLLASVSEEDRSRHAEVERDLLLLVDQMADCGSEVQPRDVQGFLGNLLLKESGEEIDMLDHRAGQNLSRSSIVDELFDDDELFVDETASRVVGAHTPDFGIAVLIVLVVIAAAVLLVLQALGWM